MLGSSFQEKTLPFPTSTKRKKTANVGLHVTEHGKKDRGRQMGP